jgi:regulator of replication initiation timing
VAELGGTKDDRRQELSNLHHQIQQQKTELLQLAHENAKLKFENVSIARELAQAQQALSRNPKQRQPLPLPSNP